MKQNSQWLSHVRSWSNSAEWTSMPSGSPAAFSTSTCRSSPPRRTSSDSSGSSVSQVQRMMSRGASPSTATTSSPTSIPARAAGEPGATERTRGADMVRQAYGAGVCVP